VDDGVGTLNEPFEGFASFEAALDPLNAIPGGLRSPGECPEGVSALGCKLEQPPADEAGAAG
jgi:hypothetical protein